MNVDIYSRESIIELIERGFPENTAIISFYDPSDNRCGNENRKIDYSKVTDRVFYVCIPDIDLSVLPQYNLDYNSYFSEVNELAEFIYKAWTDGVNIICQCEYGQSRSAGCAAAIREYFCGDGIKIYADYRYYPNQLVYNKVKNALDTAYPRK